MSGYNFEGVKYTTPGEVKNDAFEPITCLSGRIYGIRKIFPYELALRGLLKIPAATFKAILDKAIAKQELDEYETEQVRLYSTMIICLGVATMNVVDLPREQCAEDEVSIDDIEVDALDLFFAIARKADFGKEASSALESRVSAPRDGESFRGEAGAPGLHGATETQPAGH